MNQTTTGDTAERAAGRLLTNGFCVLPDLLPAAQVEALDAALDGDFAETPFCEGKFYGERTQRFGRVLTRIGQPRW
jgi:hypothetical protein